jgi:hypothetical protein
MSVIASPSSSNDLIAVWGQSNPHRLPVFVDWIVVPLRVGKPLHQSNPDRVYLGVSRPIPHGPRGIWKW